MEKESQNLSCLQSESVAAVLALADGSFFLGKAFGAIPDLNTGYVLGECVFNTSLTGYQEVLTDPSYAGQIVCFTNPHIGNVGINSDDYESNIPAVAGCVISELSPIVSNWRSQQSLSEFCAQAGIIGIYDVDTRALTQRLREKGSESACLAIGMSHEQALAKAKAHPSLQGKQLASKVAVASPMQFETPSHYMQAMHRDKLDLESAPHVVVLDYGVKRQMLHYLVDLGCKITLLPGDSDPELVLAKMPDALLLTNGPGDPAACIKQIETIKVLVAHNIPTLAICLGCQLLATALGATTYKLIFGHHGANHPVQDLRTGKVFITSQNHGFAVSSENLPADLVITHRSLFDNSIQGFTHRDKPFIAVQGHPEASPGPHEWREIFLDFIGKIQHAEA